MAEMPGSGSSTMKKYIILFFLIGSLAMAAVVSMNGSSLKTPATPNGILNLEFAYNSAKTAEVMNAWASGSSVDNIARATQNTWLDFIFILFYSIFLFLASEAISGSFGGKFGRAGNWIAKGALLAGGMDLLENTGMLLTLAGKGSDAIALCTFICSVIKWGTVMIAILYVLTGGIGLLRAKLKG